MKKKPYVKIEYLNCCYDWVVTICPWSEVEHQISGVEIDFTGIDEKYPPQKFRPEIHLSVVFLTDKEWDVELKKWDR